MTAIDFRRIVLGMAGAVERSHMDHPDFRVGNRIFASLTRDEQLGMVLLPPGDVQQEFIRAHPSAFSMVNGAWGLRGATRVHLESAEEDAVGDAVTAAWRHAMTKGPSRGTKVARGTKSSSATKGAKTTMTTKKSEHPARTLNEMLAPYPRDVQTLARATRAVVMEVLPAAKETVDATGPYITYGFAPGYKGVVSYITVNQKGVKLGVARGTSLPDPKKLLRGSGKANRHVVIETRDDLETPGLRPLLRAAFAAWKKEHA